MTLGSKTAAPRTVLLLRLLWRCAFCIFAVLAGNVVLLAVPQAREALVFSLAGVGLFEWRTLFYVLAVLYWALSAWFVARLLLSRRFANDSLGVYHAPPFTTRHPFVNWVATSLPRVLGLLATLPLCLLTWQTNRAIGAVTAAACALFLVALVLRTKMGSVVDTVRAMHGAPPVDRSAITEQNSYATIDELGPASRQTVLGLLAFGTVLLGGFWWLPVGQGLSVAWLLAALWLWRRDSTRAWPKRDDARRVWWAPAANLVWAAATLLLMATSGNEVGLAQHLASPAILLFGLGSIIAFGGLMLNYLPKVHGLPGMAVWLLPVLVGLGSLKETHWVAQRPCEACTGPAGVPDWRAARPPLPAHFQAWVAQVPAGDPVYMAALVGGASRAAFWSGTVLARLEDEARAQNRRFAANLFALSSVSGGSLGAAAFVADLAQFPGSQACPRDVPASGPCRQARLQGFLGADFLSPVVSRLLFPDLFVRFTAPLLPDAWSARADRSLGLEEAWADNWASQLKVPGPAPWGQPITGLYAGQENLPALLLNTVRLEDGQRFMQSNLQFTLPGVLDLLDLNLDTRRLTLAQAVHNSARFPYVSPAAVVKAKPADGTPLGRLGDGGYHEASGAATLADLLQALQKADLLRERRGQPGLWACRSGWPAAEAANGDCAERPSPVVALVLDNEPAHYPASHVRHHSGAPVEATVGSATGHMPLAELLAPVLGGLSTRTELAAESQQRLSRLVGPAPTAFIELRMPLWRTSMDPPSLQPLCEGRDTQPSMNWALDACSRARLQAAAEPGAFATRPSLSEQALAANFARLRGIIRASAPASGVR